jgi:hypothetical protein
MRRNNSQQVLGAMALARGVSAINAIIGGLAVVPIRFFATPAVAVYSWNRMTPASFPHWEFWPAVGAMFVISVLMAAARGPIK